MGKNTKRSKSQRWVNGVSNADQCRVEHARHVLGSDHGYGSTAERVGQLVPKHADPNRF